MATPNDNRKIEIAADLFQPKTWEETVVISDDLVNSGIAKSPAAKPLQSTNFKTNQIGWRLDSNGDLEANDGTFRGTITATTGTIGGWSIGATALTAGTGSDTVGMDSTATGGDDIRFYAGDATPASAPFRVTESGALVASSATITGALTAGAGSDLGANYITGKVASANTNLASQGWEFAGAFSSSDADTVAWSGADLTAADGTAYTITGGNTGNMAALTYIYLDIGTSTTAFQTSTTSTDAVGDGKVLVAVAENDTDDATFQVFGGSGGALWTTENIGANAITANEITANAVTAAKIDVAQLSAISADLGTVTAGSLSINSGIASIASDGKAIFTDVQIGTRFVTVDPGESIQDAIDLVASNGGTVFLRNGTHTVTSDLTLSSKVYLIGENLGAAIIDFDSNSASIKATGTDLYSTGTVTISTDGTTVTGSGTTWIAGMVGRDIMLGGVWYPISAFGSTTSITIGLPYSGPDLSGAAYQIATTVKNIKMIDLKIINSTDDGIQIHYGENIFIIDCHIQSNAVGLDLDYVSNSAFEDLRIIANGTGFTMDNCHFAAMREVGPTYTTVGAGLAMTNCSSIAQFATYAANCATDGIKFTSCNNISLVACTCIVNNDDGIELVSGNSDININAGAYEENGGDGIAATATSDNIQIIGNSVKDNGVYGVNIVASTCDNINITANNFSGNTTDEVNDSGTGTVIRGNVGVDDNSTGAYSVAVFGGDGSDGALAVSSGTTTIDCSNAKVVIKQYSSISITGTGAVDFSNPNSSGTMVVFKSQGDVTLTSSATPMLDFRDLGGAGGAGSTTASQNAGTDAKINFFKTAGGDAGAGTLSTDFPNLSDAILYKYSTVIGGAGGEGGTGQSGGTGGGGGNGGGVGVVECAGDWNFTTASGISVAGQDASARSGDGGGGGGGGGGTFLGLYTTLTANSGSVVATGGAATEGNSGTGGSGGGGASADGSSNAGNDGGAGGAGDSSIVLNTLYA